MARRPGQLPLPLSLMVSGTAQHDLPAAKKIFEDHLPLRHGHLLTDKAYLDATWPKLWKRSIPFSSLLHGREERMTSSSPATLFLLLLALSARLSSAFSTGLTVSPISSLHLRSGPFRACCFKSLAVSPPHSFPLFSCLDSHYQ